MTIMEAHELKANYHDELESIHVFDIEKKWSKFSELRGYRWLFPTKENIKKVFGDEVNND